MKWLNLLNALWKKMVHIIDNARIFLFNKYFFRRSLQLNSQSVINQIKHRQMELPTHQLSAKHNWQISLLKIWFFISSLVKRDALSIYVFKNFLSSFGGSLIFFVGLFLLVKLVEEIDNFIKVSDYVTMKEYILYFVYLIPYYINYIYPITALFSIVYALGQMHSKNEIIMMNITGYSVYYYCKFVILFIFGCSTCVLFLQDDLMYKPYQKHLALVNKIYHVNRDETTKEIKRVNLALFGENNKIFFIKEYSETTQTMFNAHVVYLSWKNDLTNLIAAERIFYDKEKKLWIGTNLSMWEISYPQANSEESVITNIQTYDTMELALSEKPYFFQSDNQKIIEISAREAKKIAKKLTIIGGDSKKWWTAYHFKLALPYVAFFILFIGIPISTYSKRSTLVTSLFFVILIAFVYIVINEVGNSLGRTGILNPLFGGWFGNVIFAIIGYIFYRQWAKV